MAEGQPSRCAVSKQFCSLQVDFSIQLKKFGQKDGEGGHMLQRRVSEMMHLTFNQGEPRSKGTQGKKSRGKP